MKFEKYHGLGNDFIIFNYRDVKLIKNLSKFAKEVCNRHSGIGADGMLILKEKEFICQMIIYNSDGSLANMCGNGIRCFAHYIYNNNILEGNSYEIETRIGILNLNINKNSNFTTRVNMGVPYFNTEKLLDNINNNKPKEKTITVGDRNYKLYSVLIGVLHTVIFVDDMKKIDIEKLGPIIENNQLFPEKTNANFVEVINKNEIIVKSWEIGNGYTLACGTGSSASVAVGRELGVLNNRVIVHFSLGDLMIEVDNIHNNIYMSGPSELIAKGRYYKKE